MACPQTITLAAASEDQTTIIQASDLLAGVTDPDIVNNTNPGGDVLVVENLSTNGTLTNNNDGTYKFRGDENFNGTAQLNYLTGMVRVDLYRIRSI